MSNDFSADMGRANTLLKEYVLPDYKTIKKGFVREESPPGEVIVNTGKNQAAEVDEEQQVVRMTNDRFAVPEILFSPSDIGINQAGLAEAIV